ncbi:MAG: ATP-binding protein [Thermodesulfobacteriota bacterium]|nr:ATP-binding protein [Thermodesulfobacteriota bacterium]
MYSRIINFPQVKSFFLFGPRATGKTTWLQQMFPSAVHIDLLESELYSMLLASPSRLARIIPPDCTEPVIIDEVQRIPELLNEVHRLIEQKKLRFVLTGSSARKLRAKGVNLLAGRALTRFMHPLTVEELGTDFSLRTSVKFGHLPAIYSEPDPGDYLASYIRTYLREEVQQEGLTRNLQVFARFLEAAGFSQGSILNISEVARECGANRKLVEQYFYILEDLLLAHRVPVFTKRARRRMVRHPKFYFFDAGVYRAIRPKGPLDRPEEIEGMALETLVFQELLAVNDLYRLGYELYYWRTSNGLEVDFILYGEAGLIAIEVKRAAKIRSKEFRGLKAFARDYPMASLYMFYGGDTKMFIDNITLIPIKEALMELPVLCEFRGQHT